MKAKELISVLQTLDPEKEVVALDDFGFFGSVEAVQPWSQDPDVYVIYASILGYRK